MKRICTALAVLVISVFIYAATPSEAVVNYIDAYKEIAIHEMIEYRIPASIILAQGILESGAGLSQLTKESNNHFGIKCHLDWSGDKVYFDDDAKDDCFRKYNSGEDSYRDHSEFLSSKQRYSFLFEYELTDYKRWAKGLKEAGYATNPKYADLLISIIEEYELHEYDTMTLADVKKKPEKNIAEIDKSQSEKVEDKTREPKKQFNWRGYASDVVYFNRIPAIIIKSGDTPEKLAQQHKIRVNLLYDYNDLDVNNSLDPGTNFYLQPKRKTGAEKYHVVENGETMWSISRDFGVRLDKLYEYNKLKAGQEPATGEKLHLKNKRTDAPKIKQIDEKQNVSQHTHSGQKSKQGLENTPSAPDENIILDDEEAEQQSPQPSDIKELNTPSDEINKSNTQVQPELSKAPVYYTVSPKETLYGISKKHGVTVQQLQQWNQLTENDIKIGQKLIVGYK